MHVELCFFLLLISCGMNLTPGDWIWLWALEDRNENINSDTTVIELWTKYLVTVLNWNLSILYSVVFSLIFSLRTVRTIIIMITLPRISISCWQYARHYSQHLTCEVGTVIVLFYRWRNWGPEKWNELLKFPGWQVVKLGFGSRLCGPWVDLP